MHHARTIFRYCVDCVTAASYKLKQHNNSELTLLTLLTLLTTLHSSVLSTHYSLLSFQHINLRSEQYSAVQNSSVQYSTVQ